MTTQEPAPLTAEELAGEGVTALPDKEVVSILDLAADVDLAIDGAAPIDLAVALNANVVAPIDAAVSANVLSDNSTSQALADQGVQVTQTVDADAVATGVQDSTIDQADTVEGGASTGAATGDAVLDASTTTDDATQPRHGRLRHDGRRQRRRAGTTRGASTCSGRGAVDGTSSALNGACVDSAGTVIGTVLDGATGDRRRPDGDRRGDPRRGHRNRGRRDRQPRGLYR